MRALLSKLLGWCRTVASESDGAGSSSRIVALLVAGTAMGVLVACVAMGHGLPSAEQLYGIAAIVAAGLGGYAANKFGRSDG